MHGDISACFVRHLIVLHWTENHVHVVIVCEEVAAVNLVNLIPGVLEECSNVVTFIVIGTFHASIMLSLPLHLYLFVYYIS